MAAGPDWKQEQVGEPWYSGDSVNMSIGQGFLLITPLQLANMYNTIAGSGVLRTPLLVQRIASPDGVVGGTAYSTFLGSSVAAAGKSGTAEDIIFQDHVFFVAYAPRDDPAIVVLVALDEGQSGSLEAGPMVRRVLEAYLASG
ncbi:MAG: hypothetical protein AMJ38_05335 [Dehalococcoidia bacterium DG_22]|nr:MAG: hypothetical protein AMJ38_05335 [Dehalococcoidia bacterium DG_22]